MHMGGAEMTWVFVLRGHCSFFSSNPRVTKDRLGLQAPQALQAPEGHLVTQGRMVPEEFQVYP